MLRQSEKFVVLQIGDKTDSLSVDRLKPVVSAVPVTPAVPPPQGSSLRHKTSRSWSSSSEESEVLRSGFCYEAPPGPSSDSSRFSAPLRRPPASPSRASNLWLLQ